MRDPRLVDPTPAALARPREGARPNDVTTELYEQCSPGAFRLALILTGNRDEADDLVQEAFVRVMRRSLRARPPESVAPYLRRTIVNLSRSRYRKIRSQRRYLEAHGRDWEDKVAPPDIESRHDMWRVLLALPVRQRAVLFLRYYEDMSEAEASDILGCSTNAVKCLAARALANVRSMRKEEGME